MSSPTEFHGWIRRDKKAAEGHMTWSSFTPKPFKDVDVDINITHCGICGGDIHTLRSGWGATQAMSFASEQKVGVGAQAFSCLQDGCEECNAGMEPYCTKSVGTYNGKYPDGSWSMGGYADYVRLSAHFAVKIPAGLGSEDAAPMMCGGITVYSPLKKTGAGPGKKADWATSACCSPPLSAKTPKPWAHTDYIATSEDDKWARKHSRSLDLIISTVSSPDMPLESYLRLLRTGGQFIQVGAPEDKLPPIAAFGLIGKGCKIAGSQIRSPKEIEEMLKFAAEKGVKPWTQKRNMKDANRSVVDMENGDARYRYVLVNADNGGRAKM